jgi:hypothetical protein
MGCADITPDEAALGFEVVKHATSRSIVFARIGNGIRAVKLIGAGGACRYEIAAMTGSSCTRPHIPSSSFDGASE